MITQGSLEQSNVNVVEEMVNGLRRSEHMRLTQRQSLLRTGTAEILNQNL